MVQQESNYSTHANDLPVHDFAVQTNSLYSAHQKWRVELKRRVLVKYLPRFIWDDAPCSADSFHFVAERFHLYKHLTWSVTHLIVLLLAVIVIKKTWCSVNMMWNSWGFNYNETSVTMKGKKSVAETNYVNTVKYGSYFQWEWKRSVCKWNSPKELILLVVM